MTGSKDEKREKKVSYYLKQFKQIDEGKRSWNISAFVCTAVWAVYRKMYLEALIICISTLLFNFLFSYLYFTFAEHVPNIFGLSKELLESLQCLRFVNNLCFLIPCCVVGQLANRLYYNNLKKKIVQGYHLCNSYKPTDLCATICVVTLIIFTIILSVSAISVYLTRNQPSMDELTGFITTVYLFAIFFLILISSVICCAFWYKDKKNVRNSIKDNLDYDREINEENIKKLI